MKAESPADALRAAQADRARERQLLEKIDRIVDQETVKNEATAKINAIWQEIRDEGFDIPQARSLLVRRACRLI